MGSCSKGPTRENLKRTGKVGKNVLLRWRKRERKMKVRERGGGTVPVNMYNKRYRPGSEFLMSSR